MLTDDRRLNVIHQSATRPILILGAERRMAIILYSVCAGLIIGPDTFASAVVGVMMAVIGHAILVYLAKLDPQFLEVYLRNWRLTSWPYGQDFYPARASVWAPSPARVRPTVPAAKQI